jgi:hypothetical protein
LILLLVSIYVFWVLPLQTGTHPPQIIFHPDTH